MELVKFVTINVELVMMNTLVYLAPKTPTEPPPQIVHVLMDIMIMVLPFVLNVTTDVPPVTMEMNVLLVPPEELTHQLVTVQWENSITVKHVLLVAINAKLVLIPLATVPFVTKKESKTHQAAHVHPEPSNLMDHAMLVLMLVLNVPTTPTTVTLALETESTPQPVLAHPDISMMVLTENAHNVTIHV